MESVEVGARAKSTPVNMPSMTNASAAARPLVPVLIESGSCSKSKSSLNLYFMRSSSLNPCVTVLCFLGSHEQSPRLFDSFHYESTDSEPIIVGPDSQLKEDLADAMRDCAPQIRESGEFFFFS